MGLVQGLSSRKSASRSTAATLPLLAALPFLVLIGFIGRPAQAQFLRLFDIKTDFPGSVEFDSPSLGEKGARAGDVDGDGLDDILLAGPQVLLIYGQDMSPGKLDPFTATIRKSAIDAGSYEVSLGGGADVNGDGNDDLFLLIDRFSTVVIFGSSHLPEHFDTSMVGGEIPGVDILPTLGIRSPRVSLCQDINGDGLGEILVGDSEFKDKVSDTDKGKVYVIFGQGDFPPKISLEDVGAKVPGFVITGSRAGYFDNEGQWIYGDRIGICVEGIGDVDADGFNDLGVAGDSCGRGSYILFGRERFPPSFTVDQIPADGLGILLASTSGCMKSMGDFNGDGFEDFALQFGGYPTNLDPRAPLKGDYDVFILGGRPRADFPLEVSPTFLLEDPRTTVLRGTGARCPANYPFDGGIDVDGNGMADLLYAGDMPSMSFDPDDGIVYFLPTRKEIPRTFGIKDIATRWGYMISGGPGDHLGYPTLNLLRDFNGDGEGEIMVGAGRRDTFRYYIIPIGEFLIPHRLGLTGINLGIGGVDGGDVVHLSGTGFFPGVEFFFGGSPARILLADNQSSAWVQVPPWPGGPMTVDIAARRGNLSAVLEGAFRYIQGPFVDVRDIAAGNVRGTVLFSSLKFFNDPGSFNLQAEFLEPAIDRLEIVQDFNADGIDDILLFWDAGPEPGDPDGAFAKARETSSVIFGGSHLEKPFDYAFPPEGKGFVMPYTTALAGTAGIDEPRVGRLFGSGDVDGDGIGDLACMTFPEKGDGGSIYILYGGWDYPSRAHPKDFRKVTRIYGIPGSNDLRIIGDLDGGGRGDLVYGFWAEDSIYDDGVVLIRGEDLETDFMYMEYDYSQIPRLEIRMHLPEIRTMRDLDWNGDGVTDLALSSAEGSLEGILILYGGKSYLRESGAVILDDDFLRLQGEDRGTLLAGRPVSTSSFWAHSLADVGDIDGDGAGELVIGNSSMNPDVGGQTIMKGGEAYLIGKKALENDLLYPEAVRRWEVRPSAFYDPGNIQKGIFSYQGSSLGEGLGGGFSSTGGVTGTGDMNGDGLHDFALGTMFLLPTEYFSPENVPGMPYTYVIFGRKNLLDGGNIVPFHEEFKEGLLIRGGGNLVAGGFDVNGDGFPDLITARMRSPAYILFGGQELGTFRFRRGDVNLDGKVDISDPVQLLSYLFLGNERPRCLDAADVDDGGQIDISDAINILGFLFLGGDPPKDPFPDPGRDPTEDTLTCR